MLFRILSFCLICSSTPVRAAYTLEQVFNSAARSSEVLSSAQLDIEKQQDTAKAIEAQSSLKVQVGGDFSRRYSQFEGQELKSGWDPVTRLELRQPIYEGGALAATAAVNQHRTEAARWDLVTKKEDLYAKLAELFYQILGLEQEQQTLKESLVIYQDRVRTLSQRAAIGRSRRAEVLAARTQADGLAVQLSVINSELELKQKTLASLSGLKAPIELSDRLNLKTLSPNKTELTQPTASIAAAQARVAVAEKLLEEKNALNAPKIDLIALHNFNQPVLGGARAQRFSFGVGLSWTFYDGGLTDANAAVAFNERNQAQLEATRQSRQKQLNQDLSRQSFEDKIQQIKLHDKALALAEENLKIQRQEFENGLINNLELMQALDTRLQIKRGRDQAIYQTKLAWIKQQIEHGQLPSKSEP